MARAILAGRGRLPRLLAEAGPAEIVTFEGAPSDLEPSFRARFEELGRLFSDLRDRGVTELCLAGAMTRPPLDPARLDAETAAVMPRLMAAMGQGDDALLREVAGILEEAGFALRGAHEIRPDLLAGEGALAGAPTPEQMADAARARGVLDALGPLDEGQAAVAARGQEVGIETLQGTDAMLGFVGATAPGSGGVLVKRPKAGQDLRLDLPAVGPDTVARAAEAGLSGICLAAQGVLLLGPEETAASAGTRGLALWAVP